LVTKGGNEQFENYHLVPPVIAIAEKLSWKPITVSVKQAQDSWIANPAIANKRQAVPTEKQVALTVSGVSVNYKDNAAVSDANFAGHFGEVIAIMGENGSGKSSLLWAIQGSGTRSSGVVETKYGDPAKLSTDERLCVMTLVPQKAADLLFLNSLADELSESDKFANENEPATSRIFEALAGRLDPKTHPRDLSSGQQLALVLSLQLIKGAGIVLLDEPTRGLDYAAKRSLVAQIRKLSSEGKCVLVASHDVEFVAQVADRVLEIDKGKIVSDQSVEEALGFNSKNPSQIAQITKLEGVLTIDQIVAQSD
jgi:energy-coupling factor transport system ATP-binding protein